MPFEVDIDEEAQRFHVRYMGAVTVAERIEAMSRVFNAASQAGFCNVLVDFRNATCIVAGFEPSSRLVALLAKETNRLGGKIAHVASSESQVDLIMELLAEGQGIPLRRFSDVGAAKAWLT